MSEKLDFRFMHNPQVDPVKHGFPEKTILVDAHEEAWQLFGVGGWHHMWDFDEGYTCPPASRGPYRLVYLPEGGYVE